MNKHIAEAAALRGQGKFAEAVSVIEHNMDEMSEAERVPALLAAFYAAAEGKMEGKARELAKKLSEEDPDIPSIQPYLK